MSTDQTSTDVILRDGSTLRLRAAAPRGRRRAARPLPVALAAEPLPPLPRLPEPRAAAGRAAARARLGRARRAARGARRSTGVERVVAVANYVRLRDPTIAESAFAVADDYQGRGIGTRLLEQLAARAAEHGIERFVAEVLRGQPRHARRVRVGRLRAHARARGRRGRGALPDRRRPSATASGSTSATTRRFAPRCARSSSRGSVAVIGASRRRGSIGGELFRNILAADFHGAALPRQPRGRARRGRARVPLDRRHPGRTSTSP